MLRKREVKRLVDFRRHLFNARKEVLLGVKSIIDSRIRDIERKVSGLEKARKKGEKTPVEPA